MSTLLVPQKGLVRGLFALMVVLLLATCDGPVGPKGVAGGTGSTGAAGSQGTMGSTGGNGLAGLSCWDLNGDGVKDLGEDTNGDGAWDAQDCQGNAVSIEKTVSRVNGVLVPNGTLATRLVSCPSGWFATGGGWDLQAGSGFDFHMLRSTPSGDSGWNFAIEDERGFVEDTLTVDLWVSRIRLVM